MGIFTDLLHKHDDSGFTSTWPYGGGRPTWMAHERHARLYAGDEDLNVVGESAFQENLWALVGRTTDSVRVETMALLVPETHNPDDSEAVAVWISGLQAGYLSHNAAHTVRHSIVGAAELSKKAVAVRATIAGGGHRDDGQIRDLEVYLRYNPVDLEVMAKWGTSPTI